MTSRNKRRQTLKVPTVIPFKDIIMSPSFRSVTADTTIRLERDGESKVLCSLVASDETEGRKILSADAVRSEWFFGPSLKVAIQTAGEKYATSVKKMYQRLLDDFWKFSATDEFCKKCHQKQLPRATIGDLVIDTNIRVWYFIVNENTVAYTIRSPGDKENKRTAARNISNIMKIADTIKLNTTKERVGKSQRKTKVIDGKTYVTKPLGGIIVRVGGIVMLNTVIIEV